MPQTTSLDTWIKPAFGNWYEWDLHPLQALGTQSSDHPMLELVPLVISEPYWTSAPLDTCCHHGHLAWDWCPPLHLRCPQWPGLCTQPCPAHFYHASSPCPCETCVLASLYWLFGRPNKPGVVEKHRHVWVTPFGDAPLLRTEGHIKSTDTQLLDCRENKLPLWKKYLREKTQRNLTL